MHHRHCPVVRVQRISSVNGSGQPMRERVAHTKWISPTKSQSDGGIRGPNGSGQPMREKVTHTEWMSQTKSQSDGESGKPVPSAGTRAIWKKIRSALDL
jgi:hypothetical protein